MRIYPPDAADTLGFDVLRARLETLALGPIAQERLRDRKPFATQDAAELALHRAREYMDMLAFDDPVPLTAVLDLRPLLRQIMPAGAWAEPEDLHAVRLVLRTLRLLRRYVEERKSRYPALYSLAANIIPAPGLEKQLDALLDDEGRMREDASPELRRLRKQLASTRNALHDRLHAELRHAIAQGWATEEQPTIRAGRMVIPIRAEAKRKMAGFVHDTSATGQTVFMEPTAVLDLNNDVRLLEVEERREIIRLLTEATAEVRNVLPDLRSSLDVLHQIDEVQAVARLGREMGAQVPKFSADGTFRLRDARHPALVLRLGRARVVPLSLALDAQDRVLILTGPNAGGKSVALKTAGLCAILMACGIPVPCTEDSEIPFFTRVLVDVGDQQSLHDDLSTFTSHVKRMNVMAEEADAHSLLLLDEAGTGTDPDEGGALAQAMIERLYERGATVLVTTHLGALKVFAHETSGILNGAMVFDEETLSPTYRLQTGRPGSSYAFEIARREGFQDEILDRARALLGSGRVALESLVLDLERTVQALETEKESAALARQEAERLRREYTERRDALRDQREQLRLQALAEAETILKEANARVERTIREIREGNAEREVTQLARKALEEHVQEVQSRQEKTRLSVRKRTTRTQPKPQTPSEPLKVGDQVAMEGVSAASELLEIRGKKAVIAQGSIRMTVALDQLRKVGNAPKRKVEIRTTSSASPSGLAALTASTRIDIRGMRADEAEAVLVRFLDEALAANLPQIEVVHGKGTGALRNVARECLMRQREVARVDEAHPEHGGAGVSVVTLR